ncbi:hypothetical protein PRBEI_2001358300 [Prionailurus iriomotensis]
MFGEDAHLVALLQKRKKPTAVEDARQPPPPVCPADDLSDKWLSSAPEEKHPVGRRRSSQLRHCFRAVDWTRPPVPTELISQKAFL